MHPPLTNLSAHWHKCSGEIPPPLVGASVTLVDSPTDVSSPGKLYLFGGRLVSTRRMVNDLWELDLGTMTWKRKSSPSSTSTSSKSQPQPRYFHSSDLWEGKLIIFGGMGYATPSHSSSNSATSKVDELCVLDEIVAYDLETEKWDLAFAAKSSHQDSNGSSSSSTSNFAPVPRYAHLSSMTSSLLTIIGGQDMANQYVESVSVFDLKQRKWIAQKDFGKQCGSYRSLAVAGRWGVREGNGENWSTLASNAGYRNSDKKGKGREESNGLNALDANRLRAGSTASNVSNLTGISSNEITSPNSYTTSSSTGLAAPSLTSTSRRPSEMSTSTSTSSTSTEYKDAALSHSMFGTNGSAHPTTTTQPNTPTSAKSKPHQQSPSLREISPLPSSYEPSETDPLPIYVYSNFNFTNVNRQLGMVDLKRGGQTSRKSKAKGKGKAKEVDGNGAAEEDQEDEEEEVLESNSNDPLGPPEITISDKSSQMDGAALPPGLRFPTGSILGSYLLISGTYLANTSQTFSIWALHLPTLTWSRLEPGSTLSSGSWNRAVLWPTKNRLLILGHRDRSLVEDYNHRQTNWDHVVLVELEAWGIYQPPVQRFDDEAVELGLEKLASSSQGSMLAEISGDSLGSSTSIPTNPQKQPESPYTNDLAMADPLASVPASANALSLPLAPLSLGGRGDMEILCSDGMKIGCDREILRNRWKWFRENDDKYQRKVKREMRKLLKQRNLANANPENPGGEDASSSSILSPSSPVGAVAGRKRGSTMSDAIRALLEDGSDDSEDEENPDNSKSTIENKENQQGSGFDATRRPSTMSIQSQSTVLSERSVSSYRPFRTPTTGFSSGLSPITPSHQINSQDHTSSPVTSHDPRFLPRQLILNEPSPIVLAFLQYLYSQTLCTPLQRHPATIAALLVLAAAYDMPDLGAWARHAAHVSLTRDLSPEPSSASTTNPGTPTSTEPTHSINNPSTPTLGLNLEQKHRLAVVLTESAALCGCEPLQIRALRSSMVSSKWLQRGIQDAGRSRSGTTTSYGTERSYNESGSSSIFGKNDASSAIGSNRETPAPTAHGSVDARSRSNSTMTSPGGSTSGHVRRFSLTAGGQATSRAQPPSNAPPPAPAIREAYNRSSTQSTGNANLEPGESGTDDSDSSLPPLNPSRKASTGLSKAERMLGITGAEAQAAGLPGTHNSASLGSESRNPSQRRPSAGASTAGSMLSVRSGNSGGGGGRKRFSIFGRSSNSSSTLPTVNTNSTTTSNSTNKSSGDKSPVSRSSGNFDEDGNKRRSSELNSNHSNQGLVGGIHASIPNRSTSSYLNSSTSSGTLASHLDPGVVNPEASKSSNSLNPDLQDPTATSTMGRKSLKSRPSNSSSVVSAVTENVYLQNRQPLSGQLDSRELSSLRALGTL